jgi:hypothetical protein
MGINWTTVIASGVVASIVGVFQVVANRYSNRILDHIEKILKNDKPSGQK